MDELTDHPDVAELDAVFTPVDDIQWYKAAYLAIHHPTLPLSFLWLLAQVPGTNDKPKPGGRDE